jgi:phage shock protein PspC (stress-responsive transcriptional regulator)
VTRSFTERILGGVCGGLAASLRLNAWFIRAVFIAGTIGTSGALLALYPALWWTMPQESLVKRHGGVGSTLGVLLFTGLVIGLWVAERTGTLPNTPTGQTLYLPALATVLGLAYLLRQLRTS